jgi:hypothetical protein
VNAFRLICAALLPPCASAVEVHIHFTALERMLSEQMFTAEGRKYVRGDRNARCNFAYLEQPYVLGLNGKLEIHARFTGRTALDVFGRCLGVSDAFDIIITAVPEYRDNAIAFRQVSATAPKGGFYARSVCSTLAPSLQREFRYPLAAEAKRALEDTGSQPAYKRELRRFNVTDVHVTADALVLHVDFDLRIH